jgi:hypothetical protein
MTEETCQHDVAIAQAADAIRAGTVSAVELMEALLARSRDLDPRLRVWETLDEEAALEAARFAQAEIESSGPKGPLHGDPSQSRTYSIPKASASPRAPPYTTTSCPTSTPQPSPGSGTPAQYLTSSS